MDPKELERKVQEILPADCGLTKVEPEGLEVVIYLKSMPAFYANDQLIRKLAGALRKRVVIRSDASALMPPTEAQPLINRLIPQDAGAAEIKFDPDFSEVVIEALKPGLVIGKGGTTLKEIITRTGWAPRVLRTPTMASSTIRGIRSNILKESAQRKKFLQQLGKKVCGGPIKSEWVRVTCLGGFQEVGRSCTLLQTPNTKIMIDCGINPETSEPTKAYPYLKEMNFELSELDAVILTHAHLDHSGFVPYLYAYGYDGPVYCTPPTRDLVTLLQMDYIDLMSKYSNSPPPYGVKDIHKQLSHTITLNYNEVIDISPEVKLTFANAGHILGSAMVHLHIGEGLHNVVFSGDVKYGFTKLFDQANTNFQRVETMFLESTYGGRNDIQPSRFDTDRMLIEHVMRTIQNKGKVLIPVFAVGRSQEIMLVLEEYARSHPDFNVPVYIDGMILEASAIHTVYPEYLRHNVQRRILSNDSPFESKIFQLVKRNRKEIAEGEPAVVLAPSGMMSGGPSVEFLRLMADDAKNQLLFVGYQSALSLGRKLQRGLKELPMTGEEGRIDTLRVNMSVNTVEGFSGHSDRHQLMALVKNMKPSPERVFTGHGDETKCEDLSRGLNKMLHIETRAPMNLDTIRLE